MKISHYPSRRRWSSLGSPLFHVAARCDVNCPVIRGEYHRARVQGWRREGLEKRKQKERTPPGVGWWMVEWWRFRVQNQNTEWNGEKGTRGRQTGTGWKIRGCPRFVIYKRPFWETSACTPLRVPLPLRRCYFLFPILFRIIDTDMD